jgi:putative Mg2+ transporter-C (MgtC) family protein
MLSMLGRLGVSALLGGVVGLERELNGRPAGLRTHTLVCLGAALITLVSEAYVGDQARIAAQIVSGIGFLGAGTIIREGHTVRGLTTAASLWAAAGLGIACGHGGETAWLAFAATFLIVGTLAIGKVLEERILLARERNVLTVHADDAAVPRLLQGLLDSGIAVESATRRRSDSGVREVALRLHLPAGMEPGQVLRVALGVHGVSEATWAHALREPNGG